MYFYTGKSGVVDIYNISNATVNAYQINAFGYYPRDASAKMCFVPMWKKQHHQLRNV